MSSLSSGDDSAVIEHKIEKCVNFMNIVDKDPTLGMFSQEK